LLNPTVPPALLAVGDLLLPLSLLVNPFPPPNPRLLLPLPAPKSRAAAKRTPPAVLELPLFADDDRVGFSFRCAKVTCSRSSSKDEGSPGNLSEKRKLMRKGQGRAGQGRSLIAMGRREGRAIRKRH